MTITETLETETLEQTRERLRKRRLENALDNMGIKSYDENEATRFVCRKIIGALNTPRIGAVVECARSVIPSVNEDDRRVIKHYIDAYKYRQQQ